MISDSDLTNADYIPYHHTALTIPLTSPLFEGDKICYVRPGESYVNADGETVTAGSILYGCYRENGRVVLDGSESWFRGEKGIYQSFGIVKNSVKNIEMKSNRFVFDESASKGNIISIGGVSTNNRIYIVNGVSNETPEFKSWLSENPTEAVYKIAQPYFEPFTDQSIFYGLRTDDTLTYIYSSDPIEPNVTVDVAKNSTGGILLESYTALAQLIGETVIIE